MTWLTTYGGSAGQKGRVSLAHIQRFWVEFSTPTWRARADLTPSAAVTVADGLASEAGALAKIDDLILNGS